jgi:acetyltransferase-like isoleucine patch superfamily enzyme
MRIPRAVIALNLYPPLHAAAVGVLAAGPWTLGLGWPALPAALALLYLGPPLAARVLLAAGGLPPARIPVGSRAFVRWWALLQLQVVFARLPFLEEALRLVPGLYSAWLRLWGARIGRYVYWAPEVRLTDRYLVEVGEQALVGMGTVLVSHLVIPGEGPAPTLLLARVTVGAGAQIGGLSLLGPGSRVPAGQATPARTVLPPFWSWVDGRRVPGAGGSGVERAMEATR